MEPKAVFRKILNDEQLTKNFIDNPIKVLQELDVDTSSLKITKTDVVSSGPPVLKGGCPSTCASIGCVGCVSVGT